MAERVVLRKLADLVPESDDRRRRVLENLDKLAQGAIDAERTYTNKYGEDHTVPQPDWNVAVKAMESACRLLGLEAARAPESAAAGQDGPIVAAIRDEAGRALRAVPK